MFTPDFSQVKHVLCLGAHADDIEIGCGATLLQLLGSRDDVTVHWVVLSANEQRQTEAHDCAEHFLRDASNSTITIANFDDSYFPSQHREIKALFHKLRQDIDPDLIFTHRLEDRHQDHRTVAELTWNAFRDHLVLEYEIPKFEGDLGQPNVYVPADEATSRAKADTIYKAFPSQQSRAWFTPDTFLSLMRIRGIECGPSVQYAEAFHSRKMVVGV
jgi:LmbE family N-acetylglucosaminyl deacetylase